MKTDWTEITRGMGDAGKTAGVFCAHLKSEDSIMFLSLLEAAQIKLGKIASCDLHVEGFWPYETIPIEKAFRKIMGKVSAHKNVEKYIEKYGKESVLQEKDIQSLDSKLINLGTMLNAAGVAMDWIDYSNLTSEALMVAEFTTALRTAECVFFKFLNNEVQDKYQFDLEAQYLNRLSKVTHLGMILNNYN